MARIAWLDAIRNKESVTGVVWMVGVAERVKIGLEMDVMELLGDLIIIYAFCNKTNNKTERKTKKLALHLTK